MFAQIAFPNHFSVCLGVFFLSLALSSRAKEDSTSGTELDLCIHVSIPEQRSWKKHNSSCLLLNLLLCNQGHLCRKRG